MKRLTAFLLVLALLSVIAGCAQAPVLKQTDPSELPSVEQTEPSTAVTEPSVEPTTESAESVLEPNDDDFVRVVDYIPQIRQALAYATEDNFTGQVIYEFTDAYLRYGTVKKLAKVCEELAQQRIGVLIWDGYRPVYAQAELFDICPDPTYVSPPGTGNQNHCRGRAIDLTLVDLETGKELEMPTGFDDFTDYADRDYSDVSAAAATNAALLEEVMEKHGFMGYSKEWWHYNDTDDYPIEEEFDPAAV